MPSWLALLLSRRLAAVAAVQGTQKTLERFLEGGFLGFGWVLVVHRWIKHLIADQTGTTDGSLENVVRITTIF
ncbi:MAG: hypothetical protein LC797_23280 [Chloroflexi bacterium]|nr:hypothetical protein [Chloroflexota bacterium]